MKPLQYYMRATHRVLGYLTLGMVMVYALSGIVLIHRTGDFMKRQVAVEQTIAPGLDADGLASALKMKNFKVTDISGSVISFPDGTYDSATGQVSYLKKEIIAPFNRFVDLHKLPDAKNPHVALVTTIFGIVLFLLALTSLFMYKPSTGPFKTNMIYVLVGVAVTLVLLLVI